MALTEQMHDLHGLGRINPGFAQGLRFAEGFPAADAVVSLHGTIFILKMTRLFARARAVVTIQLAFPGRVNYCQACI
jgi:hypothetical protein